MTVVWSLAGHDPMAVAGLQIDLRVAINQGVTLRTLMVSFTAQNHQSMLLCEAVPQAWIEAQWRALIAHERPQVIKLGLIRDAPSLRQLRQLLAEVPEALVICDPVLASSSGYTIAEVEFLDQYREMMFPFITLLTPNRPEAEQLLQRPLRTESDIKLAARDLLHQGVKAVLIKGGHSEGQDALDYFDDGQRGFWLANSRKTGSFRGTGCALSTAIACKLAGDSSLREAVVLGHAVLQEALDKAQGQHKGALWFSPPSPPPLGRLSYQGYFPGQHFLSIDDGPLGFYPIVPDVAWLKRLLSTGIRTIQLRLKGLDPAATAQAIEEANALCRQARVRLFINDHWQIALRAGVYGVHLGQEDLDGLGSHELDMLRKSGLRLGISTHSPEEAARALSLRPSYIALGPIFTTSCKSMNFGPQGMVRIKDWKHFCPLVPLVVIGGLKLEHGAPLLDLGVDGIAVISDVLQDPAPEQRTREWLKLWAF